jgi:hypothetical protein
MSFSLSNDHRASKHAGHAKSHLDHAVEWLTHIHADLGPIVANAEPPAVDGGSNKNKKRSLSEGGDSGAPAKKKSTKKKPAAAKSKPGEKLGIKEREENAMISLTSHIEELGGTYNFTNHAT